jgi:arabinogalactan endo-1,4-beta-galactosidase
MMAHGYTWKNASGTTEDQFTILPGYGIGAIRLRTWADMTYAKMLQAMYTCVYDTMEILKYNHVSPEWVQIGNEISSGICLPTGGLNYPTQMTGLPNAAYDMVKTAWSTSTLEPTIIMNGFTAG